MKMFSTWRLARKKLKMTVQKKLINMAVNQKKILHEGF